MKVKTILSTILVFVVLLVVSSCVVNNKTCEHMLEDVEEKDATCIEDGNIFYKHCSLCEKNFDKTGKEILDIVIPAKGHILEDVAEVKATCTDTGNVFYKHCSGCNKNFDDSGIEILDVVVPAKGHFKDGVTWNSDSVYHWQECLCGYIKEQTKARHEWDYSDANVSKCSICNLTRASDEHIIIWENFDGTILEVDEYVKTNTAVSYDGNTPTKDATDTIIFEFKGWSLSKDGELITEELLAETDLTLYAVFEEKTRMYKVTINYLNLDGTIKAPSKYEEYEYNTIYTVEAPEIDGFVANTDYVKGHITNDENIVNIYYSELSLWDGSSISDSLSGSGLKNDPFLIQSAADLAFLKSEIENGRSFNGQYIKLTRSIDLNNANFIITYMDGTFDGNNCSVRGLEIVKVSDKTGLFGDIYENGVVKNLSVYGNINGVFYTGGIAGASIGIISNCNNYVSIFMDAFGAGGIVGGFLNGSNIVVENCVNYGTVTISENGGKSGGVCGAITEGNPIIRNCDNYGTVSGGSRNIGGILGEGKHSFILTGCNNYGDVITSVNYVGGIVGTIADMAHNSGNNQITYSNNYAKVTGNNYVGGIAGHVNSYVLNCKNYGEVSGNERVGGIVGQLDCKDATLSKCGSNNNYANVVGNGMFVGGIIGACQNMTLRNCKNYADIVTKNDYSGGIIGCATSGVTINLYNCYNEGTIKSKGANVGQLYGGLWGSSKVETVEGCLEEGSILAGAQ